MRYTAGQHVGRVTCDGVELADVMECDDAEGWAVVYDRNAAGQFYLAGDEVARRRVTGVIVFKSDLPVRS